MNYLRTGLILIISLLLYMIPQQANAQVTPSKAQIKEIQDILTKMKDLMGGHNPKKRDDPEVKKLAAQAITLADKYYKIPGTNLFDGKEPTYNPACKMDQEGRCTECKKKVIVEIGLDAFDSPGELASTKYHEIVVHGNQAATGRWYTSSKGSDINEIEAYDAELKMATIFGLDDYDIDRLESRRKKIYDGLDAGTRKKIDEQKAKGQPYTVSLVQPSTDNSMISLQGSTQLFVAGTVLSEERMLVTVRGTRTVEGNVVTAELNGKKTTSRTDANGSAFIDLSAIATGLAGTAVAIIKTFDAKGKEISTATTTVQQGTSRIFNQPTIAQLPDNISTGQVMTTTGRHMGADAQLVIGDQVQETLSASDKELTVFTNSTTGNQSAYVTTPNGVSQTQSVNIYSLDFSIPRTSITPKELVNGTVSYKSIPVGTRLIFTNSSPSTINMVIPGATNSTTESIYTVTNTSGTIPVNITGITAGGFKIVLDTNFKNGNYTQK